MAVEAPEKPKKGNKYGAKKVTVGGITYDSKNEYNRECELKVQQKAGIIKDLKRQVTFSLDVNDEHVCNYKADWTYTIVDGGIEVVEDFKGFVTEVFRLKRRLMKACHGIDVWTNKSVKAHCAIDYPF